MPLSNEFLLDLKNYSPHPCPCWKCRNPWFDAAFGVLCAAVLLVIFAALALTVGMLDGWMYLLLACSVLLLLDRLRELKVACKKTNDIRQLTFLDQAQTGSHGFAP